jgi:hypothetical protein
VGVVNEFVSMHFTHLPCDCGEAQHKCSVAVEQERVA